MIKEKIHTLLPTTFGKFTIYAYKTADNTEPVALVHDTVKGKENVLVRLHSECLTGDVFHSLKCDCRKQLECALERISKEKEGILIYLRQEGRGIGLFNKIKAYDLQSKGLDTVEANEQLGFPPDKRDYAIAAYILKDLEVKSIRLLTNNPEKITDLERLGIPVKERISHTVQPTDFNREYLDTKKKKMGHLM